MNGLLRSILCLLAAAILSTMPAQAHTRSESHSGWFVDKGLVHLTFSVADREVMRLARNDTPVSDAQLIAYLLPRETVTNGGRPCPLVRPPRMLAAVVANRRIEFLFDCPTSSNIVLGSDAFFELVPTHVNIAQIQTAGGEFAEEVLTADDHTIDLDNASGAGLKQAGFLTFVRMGILHIFTGVDHMSFLVGLVLISRRFRDLAFVITGFTLGHSLTLALAVTGVIRPHAEYIDAMVALTIALIGIENIAVANRRPGLMALWTGGTLLAMAALRVAGIGLLPPLLLLGTGLFAASYLMVSGHLRDAGRLRLVVTLVFGLIHGFGFAADLLGEPIPTARLAELLVGFNLGVEIGQLTIVTLLAGAVYLLGRFRLTLPRPLVVDVAASALVGIGLYWFVGRSFGIA